MADDDISSKRPGDDAATVAAFWGRDRRAERKHNWLDHPTSLACINQRRAGNPDLDLAAYWRAAFFPGPAPLALSLGCGFGLWERIALKTNLAVLMEACDVSPDAVAAARRAAADEGLSGRIDYRVANLNTVDLPEGRYNAIFGISSLHHVEKLEHLFAQCRRALKPGGLFFIDEYIGPARFQSAPRVVEMINALLRLLPERYRHSIYLNNDVRESYANTPLAWFEQTDPSEAVRSDAIVDCLKQHFEIVDYKPYGGALLHMLLSGMAGNFDPEVEEDAALIRLIAFFEEELEKAGAIGSDFATLAARPLP